MRPVELLVIHCTATPRGREVTSAEIRRWHTSPPPAGRGWKQVGYTDMIHLDGSVERLARNNDDGFIDPWEVTNGAAGYNHKSRHIVYVGGGLKTAEDTRTVSQKVALNKYVIDFIKRVPGVKVAGHYQLTTGKKCPSFDVPMWLRSLGVNPKNIY